MVTELMQIRVLLLPQMAAALRQNHHRYVAANTQSGSKGAVGLEPSGKSAFALRSSPADVSHPFSRIHSATVHPSPRKMHAYQPKEAFRKSVV